MQIQTSVQHAKAVVHKYPRATKYKDVLETLAKQRGEPGSEELLQPAGLDDLQHAANWEGVIQWVESVDEKGLHGHHPLLAHAPQADTSLSL